MADQHQIRPIGIDASAISRPLRTGTETYAAEIVRQLASIAEPGELRVYLNSETADPDLAPGQEVRRIPFPRLWTHGRLSAESVRNAPSILFVPAHVVPAKHPPSVVTIHDLAFSVHPELFSRAERVMLEAATRWNAKSAAKIIAVSRRTRNDLIERFGVDPSDIVVVHHGVDQRFTPASLDDQKSVRREYSLDNPYLLAVASQHRRKNLVSLVRSFSASGAELAGVDLVLCGAPGPDSRRIESEILNSPISGSIRSLQYVPIHHLPSLMSAATALIIPSMYEGFGMPALEAMACGTVVAAAETGALREVCGSAARYFDPASLDSISEALCDVVNNTALRQRCRIQGIQWVSRFSWERCGVMTLNVLRAVRDGTEISQNQLGWAILRARPGGRSTSRPEDR
ncbi:glycosyltransferase family 1 protein [soil metagenome]